MKRRNDERTFKDPVCGMEIGRMTAIEEFVYGEKSYYFCAETCRKKFEVDPDKYILHHRQHGVKPG
jgi:YHS domain-containing protein